MSKPDSFDETEALAVLKKAYKALIVSAFLLHHHEGPSPTYQEAANARDEIRDYFLSERPEIVDFFFRNN